MPAAIDAPPRPPAGVNIVPPSSPPKAPPAPTREIHVTPSGTATDKGPIDAPKPGSAKERVFGAIRAKAGMSPPAQPAPEPPTPEAPSSPEGLETPQPEGGSQELPPPSGSPESAAAEGTTPAAPATEPKKEKVNPWKLVDQYKGQLAKLEKEVADAKSATLPDNLKKEYLTQIEQLQKRNTELEDEMRFVNYEQSTDFQEKYQKPYVRKFESIMERLSGAKIKGEDGNPRPVTPNDVLAVVSAPLDEAYAIAEEKFGRAADWVVQRGEELRSLWNEREAALTEAKTKGAERAKQQQEMTVKQMNEMKDFVSSTWNKVNQSILKDEKWSKYFSPVEGDQDGNQSLSKGFELVDRAFSESPNAPGLSNEQRAAIIQRHAAVRNRAAAAGRLIKWNQRLESKIAALEAELGKFKSTTPPAGGGAGGQPTGETPKGAWAGIQAALRAKAH